MFSSLQVTSITGFERGSAIQMLAPDGSVVDALLKVRSVDRTTRLVMTLDLEDYNEGGNNGTVLKFPKRVKYAEITLKKGITKNTELFDWFYGFTQGAGKRKDGVITLRDSRQKPHTVWGFRRGLPTQYKGPQLNAQQSSVAVYSITITHEGLFLMGGAAALGAAIGSAARSIGGLFR